MSVLTGMRFHLAFRARIARFTAKGESPATWPIGWPWYVQGLPLTSTSTTPGTALAAASSALTKSAAPHGQRTNAMYSALGRW